MKRLHITMGIGVTLAALSTSMMGIAERTNSARAVPGTIRFDTDIRPILADNCFRCHGPDRAARQAQLRLDTRAGMLIGRADGHGVVVPGDAEQSELMRRVSSIDPDIRMPPANTHKVLSAEEINRLREWIDSGAAWEEHWAFVPPVRPTVPEIESSWVQNDIDAFVLARLFREGLSPSPEADRARLIRRVTLHLTGLPPTIEEIDAFLADDEPGAYERVVARLLASPRFGEHNAVSWLDLARYADSYGYQSDQLSPTWPYRDWLVRALNRNLPYDQFIIHQLAGDLLPDADREERLATAFNRLHRMTNEGGSIEREFRIEYAADRVHTMGTAFMGMTLECARCHDHKFDPISTREYYGLVAFFNSIDEWGMYNDSSRVPTPSLLLPTAEQETAIRECLTALEAANAELSRLRQEREPVFQEWVNNEPAAAHPPPGLVAHYPLDAFGDEYRLENIIDQRKSGTTSPANALVTGKHDQALQFTGDDAANFPDVVGGLRPWEAFSIAFWLRIPEGCDDAIIFHRSGGTDVGRHGTELALKGGRLSFAMIRFWPGNAIAVRTTGQLPRNQWVHVTATNDASASAGGMHLYVNGSACETEVLRNRLTKAPSAGGSGVTFGERFRDAGLKGGAIDAVFLFDRVIAPVEVADLVDGVAFDEASRNRDLPKLREYFFAAVDEALAAARTQRAAAVRSLLEARGPVVEVPVMAEMNAPRTTHVLARGAYDAPRSERTIVERHTPRVLPGFPDDAPRDRLGLARWLAHPNHPLTSRVAVNRIWQNFFGRGLVETSEDFGVQGSRPTHPELLDYLATTFVDTGWDVKQLVHTIVTSATYRQDSATNPHRNRVDPFNSLLGRGPSRRVTAEVLRDVALAASGLLDETIGGPPVSPYQPAGLWREANTMSPAYQQSLGQALYRRSLYSVWKRTAPLPNMMAFDAAARESCTARRLETNTPVQALVLLNDPQYVEAARVLASRVISEAADDESRVARAFRLLTGRSTDARERQLLLELLTHQRALYADDQDAAQRLVAVGAMPHDPNIDVTETAAMTVVVQAIMNSDATVWQR